MLGGFEQVAN